MCGPALASVKLQFPPRLGIEPCHLRICGFPLSAGVAPSLECVCTWDSTTFQCPRHLCCYCLCMPSIKQGESVRGEQHRTSDTP